MDERSYRATYQRINAAPCAFEKAILSLKCKCRYQHLFCLADRHGVACTDAVMQKNCGIFLEHLRNQTRFVFKINIDGPLPHNKEIKVQNGGMLGLQQLLGATSDSYVEDISGLMEKSLESYGGIENIPFNRVMPAVTAYKTREKRKRRT
ncbi:hypothetical protein MNBD_GAMMA09-1512 [hydrothermal vent metagenome]|uniref:Uncharacterized protein n=1 Tax=hydrothermal vent metagenome TaxID=652676 RepID=A0A3B0XCJ4_9ZZZZ